jgi:hypothetical protein
MKIQLFAICVSAFFCVSSVSGEYCYDDVVGACSPTGGILTNCNARYGAFVGDELLTNVQKFARTHIQKSFQFLLMSSHFGNYEKNRAGFEKLYRKFSDDTWEKSIELVKFLGQRGGHMDFHLTKEESNEKQISFEMYELGSLGKALDMHKGLAREANLLHSEVTRTKEHDPQVASYLENNFVHQHSDIIRTLSGHTNDLKQLLANEADSSLALYLFDGYLEKSV